MTLVVRNMFFPIMGMLGDIESIEINRISHSSVWNRLVFRHEFILKSEIFKFKRTMFAKLFGVKAPFSTCCYLNLFLIPRSPERTKVSS